MGYKHLTREQRYTIDALLQTPMSLREIGEVIGVSTGSDFSKLTDEMLAEIEWKLNHRPRKSLGYRTPLEYCKQLFSFDF
ncbi:MAG: helix-turn-helix domain-containing protein [Bacteroidales bacterium]|nr:helix-turn-helix domain-containing protein [Bacteroidales bacterium]